MDHPNISRVLDADTPTPVGPSSDGTGQGSRHTAFCDERRLTPRQRLELFVPVCQAIQHAHQKGIIHRDIKPSNVLVGLYDGRPVPKVIDFGIAKATQAPLTEHSQVTGLGAVVGTPEYMSPEQASLDGVDVDTRSDVYALGVLFYELLTGTTPVDRKSLGRAAVLEVLRVVREVEAPRPSTRLSALDALPSIAANRSVEPARLTGLLRGELDWIAMKALEKDRSRRYETASALARDLERYLADEVVEARPPSAGYRLRKFVQRHKAQVIGAGLVVMALLAGILGATWGYLSAEQARKTEARLTQSEHRARLEAQAQKASAEMANERAQKRLAQVARGNELLSGIFSDLDIRKVKAEKKLLEAVLAERLVRAAGQLEGESVGDPLVVAAMQDRLGQSLLSLGFAPEANPVFEKARATRKARLGADDVATLTSTSNLATAYHLAGKFDLALPLQEEVLRLTKARHGPQHIETLTCMNNLAAGYLTAGKPDLALPLEKEALRLKRVKLGPNDPETLASMNHLASAYHTTKKFDLALPLYEETVRLRKARLGPEHIDTLRSMYSLAESYRAAGKPERALPLLEQTLPRIKASLGPEHPDTLTCMSFLAVGYQLAGKLDLALPLYEDAFKLREAKSGPDHPDTLSMMSNMAVAYWSAHLLDRSIPLFEEALKLTEKRLGRNDAATQTTVANLGVNYRDAGRLPEALPLLQEAQRTSRTVPALRWVGGELLTAYERAGGLAEADALIKELLADERPVIPKDSPQLAQKLAGYGIRLFQMNAFAQAEPLLRESLAIAAQAEPDAWTTFNTRSLLGAALLGQKKLDEAKPLLRDGYDGLKARAKLIPQSSAARLLEAVDRLIELYTATNQPDEVEKWRAERAKYPQGTTPEKK